MLRIPQRSVQCRDRLLPRHARNTRFDARTAPQNTSLFAPRRDRHQTTRLNVASVARRFRAAKASSFLSIFSSAV